MNRKPELPVEIEKALRRYLEIQAEEQRLKEEKNDLRERIGEHMAGLEMKYWYPKIDGQALKVRYRETTAIEYNESLLWLREALQVGQDHLYVAVGARITQSCFQLL